MPVGKIAVLGGGPGSLGTAGDLALRGFEVHFWGRNPRKLASLFKYKQIKMVGSIEATAQLAGASDELGQILKGAQLILVALPGFAQHDVAERCAPYVEDGQTILVCGNSGMGSLEFTRTFQEKGVRKDVLCAEWSGIPKGGRFIEPDVINCDASLTFQKRDYPPTYHIGVFPARRTEEAMEVLSQVYPGVRSAENCLAASLNIRPIIHQAITMLMSATAIEHLVYWDIMVEGHTPSVVKVIRAVDDERKAIQKAWGFEPTEIYGPGYLSGKTPGRAGLFLDAYNTVKAAWKDRLDMQHRFVTEAVPYGYVLRSSAAAKAGISVPITDSIIRIFSVINGEDYFSTGRTLNNLGLGGKSMEEIQRFLYEGG